jgi:hypothetical protein
MKHGDVVEVEIEGVGTLVNPVEDEVVGSLSSRGGAKAVGRDREGG